MLVVGIAGKKRHGKDAVAEMLTKRAGADGIIAIRRAFADSLKEECAMMMATTLGMGMLPTPMIDNYYRILAEMNDGDTKEKYRLLLQWWGTEFKRQMVKDSYWIDQFEEWIAHQHAPIVLVPDVRFKRLGGIVIHVFRLGLTDFGDIHTSETALDTFKAWDYNLVNVTLDDLEWKVITMYEAIKEEWLK